MKIRNEIREALRASINISPTDIVHAVGVVLEDIDLADIIQETIEERLPDAIREIVQDMVVEEVGDVVDDAIAEALDCM